MYSRCIVCNSENLEVLETTNLEVFVTGDRKDFDIGNKEIKRMICKDCGLVQFLQNEDHYNAASEVFRKYDAIHMKTWFKEGGKCIPQLQTEYKRISEAVCLPKKGKMLDLGCGNGDALSQFQRIWPEWDLYGMDTGEQFRQSVMDRKGVKGFFLSLDELRDTNLKFDFISINHMLCLVNNIAHMLETVHSILADDGILVILDTDFEVHPWILYEIEGASFYTKAQLENIIRGFGFGILDVEFKHEEKEIGILCFKEKTCKRTFSNLYEKNRKIYSQSVNFLNKVIDIVQEYINKYTYIGIFGTSIAGVWIAEIVEKESIDGLGKQVFYVEEDEEILNRKIGANGYPIYRLEEISEEAVIFLPFPKYVAENILQRVTRTNGHLKFINFYEEEI